MERQIIITINDETGVTTLGIVGKISTVEAMGYLRFHEKSLFVGALSKNPTRKKKKSP